MLSRLNHTKNFFVRMVFFIVMYALYETMLKHFGFSISRISYIVIFVIFSINYLADNLNFSGVRYNINNFLYSLIINFVMFAFYGIAVKAPRLILIGVLYTVLQNLVSYIFIRLLVKNKNVIVYGDGEELSDLITKIRYHEGYNFVGVVNNGENSLGTKEDIVKIVQDNMANILILLKVPEEDRIDDVLKLKIQGVKIIKFLEFVEEVEGKVDLRRMDGKWVLNTGGFEILNSPFAQRLKRLCDILAATFVGVLSAPIMIVFAIITKVTSSGPVIFKQERVGVAGGKFKIYKFRSMYLHEEANHSKYADENDERITPVGKFMRKTRIDELPQLWNVLKGDMSFVGPRAEWDKLHDTYEAQIPLYYLRNSVKPGLTGWAQVMYPYGANIEDTKRKLEYDIYYIKYQNFMMDLIIIMKTVKIVLFGKGR